MRFLFKSDLALWVQNGHYYYFLEACVLCTLFTGKVLLTKYKAKGQSLGKQVLPYSPKITILCALQYHITQITCHKQVFMVCVSFYLSSLQVTSEALPHPRKKMQEKNGYHPHL